MKWNSLKFTLATVKVDTSFQTHAPHYYCYLVFLWLMNTENIENNTQQLWYIMQIKPVSPTRLCEVVNWSLTKITTQNHKRLSNATKATLLVLIQLHDDIQLKIDMC